jgi:hypothetical protein
MIVAVVTVAGMLLIISRQPHALINPQLWAEDGEVWFRDAYTYGPLKPLLWADAGYLNTFQRLAAAVGLLMPLRFLPYFFASAALLVQVLPVAFLASDRLQPIWPRRWVRLAAGFAYLALPGTSGIGLNITNAAWHLALLACLIAIAPRACKLRWQVFDVAVIVLSGLSGPFCIFLFPAALVLAVRRGTRAQWAVAWLLLVTSAIQCGVLVLNVPHQRAYVLQAVHVTLIEGIRLVGLRMVMVPLLGSPLAFSIERHADVATAVALLAVAVALTATALICSSLEERLLILFGLFALAAAMATQRADWASMLHTESGHRYWFFPMLTWLLILAIVAFRTRWHVVGPLCGVLLTISLLVGVPWDWSYPTWPNQHFQRSAAEFQAARAGQAIKFVENPKGWSFVLIKKS